MRRHKGRANLRDGLWLDTAHGPVPADQLPAEITARPLTRQCPACKAQPGQRCTRPGRGGRIDLRSYHPARLEPPKEPAVPDIDDHDDHDDHLLGPPQEEPNCGYCSDHGCVECDPTVQGPEAPLPPSNPHAGDPWGDPTSPF